MFGGATPKPAPVCVSLIYSYILSVVGITFWVKHVDEGTSPIDYMGTIERI